MHILVLGVARIPMANKQKFFDAVAKLEFSHSPSEILK